MLHNQLRSIGWTDSDYQEARTSVLRQQSLDAGVSVSYLIKDFPRLALSRSTLQDPTFYDLKDAFFLSSNAVGKDILCPRDSKPGCSLLDTLNRQHRQSCTHFLSWTWGYRLTQVLNALKSWQETQPEKPTYLYMCFFVNNQYRILVERQEVATAGLDDIFEKRLQRIGKMVAVLDTWNSPRYLSRIWTIFEQFTAAKLGVEVEIIMPSSAAESVIQEIRSGQAGIIRLKTSLSQVDSRQAKAWSIEDEQRVKQLIQATIGFDTVDRRVQERMVGWIARQVQNHLITLVLNHRDPPRSMVPIVPQRRVLQVRPRVVRAAITPTSHPCRYVSTD